MDKAAFLDFTSGSVASARAARHLQCRFAAGFFELSLAVDNKRPNQTGTDVTTSGMVVIHKDARDSIESITIANDAFCKAKR